MTRFDVDPPVRREQEGGNGGWDFQKMEPVIPPPEDWPIYGPPTPGAFEGMLDGYREEEVPPLGITDEELGLSPGPIVGPVDPRKLGPLAPPPVCRVEEESDPPSGGGGRIAPGMGEAIEAIDKEERRGEVIENPMDHLFIDMF